MVHIHYMLYFIMETPKRIPNTLTASPGNSEENITEMTILEIRWLLFGVTINISIIIYLCIDLFIHLFICLCVHKHLFIYLDIYLLIHVYSYLMYHHFSIYLFIYLFIDLFIYCLFFFVHLCTYLPSYNIAYCYLCKRGPLSLSLFLYLQIYISILWMEEILHHLGW